MRDSGIIVLSLLGALLLSSPSQEMAAHQPAAPCTGIMGAFSEEVSRLEEEVKEAQEQLVMGVRFVTGTLKGRRVVLACSGVGKVNAHCYIAHG